jgi:2-dehydropantoate 2-reductase
MRMLVIGAGATGGYFGARLAEAGRDVTFLVREKRAAQLRADGLTIVSAKGETTIEPKIIEIGAISEAFDIIFLSVKAYSLAQAIDDFAPAVGKDTMVLPVLNGMRHVDMIQSRFGEKSLVGGVCRIAADLDERGRVIQQAPFHEVLFGEMDATKSTRIGALDEFMRGAGFDTQLSENIEADMWNKWLLISTLGAITCLMRANVGEIARATGGVEFVRSLLGEGAATIAACGHEAPEQYVGQVAALLTTPTSALTASMFRDLEKGNPIEADQIVGDLLERAHHAGVATPLLSAAYTQLSAYQARIKR